MIVILSSNMDPLSWSLTGANYSHCCGGYTFLVECILTSFNNLNKNNYSIMFFS